MDLKLITDSEWEIMRIVWAKAPVTSTVIIGDLEATKGWMPTTVKTFLSRLVQKKMLKFEKIGRSFLYSSVVSEEKCVRDELQAVIAKVYGGSVHEQTEHFALKGNPDPDYMKRIAEALESNYGRITTDLEASPDQTTQVYVHATQKGLHSALGLLDGPKWLRSGHTWGVLHVAPRECFDDISAEHAAVHTFVLLLIQKINPTVPYWLQQAVSTYYAGWMTQDTIDALHFAFQDFPALARNHGMLSSYVSFKEIHGYEWGYTVMDYIVKQYGIKKLTDFLRKPYDYECVFGVTEERFWEGWRTI